MVTSPYRVPTGRPESCHWCRRTDGTHAPGCEDSRAAQLAQLRRARARLAETLRRAGTARA